MTQTPEMYSPVSHPPKDWPAELVEHQLSYGLAKFSVQGVQTRLKRNDRFEISDRVVN